MVGTQQLQLYRGYLRSFHAHSTLGNGGFMFRKAMYINNDEYCKRKDSGTDI